MVLEKKKKMLKVYNKDDDSDNKDDYGQNVIGKAHISFRIRWAKKETLLISYIILYSSLWKYGFQKLFQFLLTKVSSVFELRTCGSPAQCLRQLRNDDIWSMFMIEKQLCKNLNRHIVLKVHKNRTNGIMSHLELS